MAGDNNLDISGVNDLLEMQKVVLPGHVQVAIQFDRRKAMPWEDSADRTTKRLTLKEGKPVELADLGETNTGDPAVLKAFIQWGAASFPADRYLLIIWNHGGGAKDNDIYNTVPQARNKTSLFAGSRQPFADKGSFRVNAIAMDETPANDRYVAIDDTSCDFLDNLELKAALTEAGVPLDLLAFDACLMSMIEIQYQLKDCATFILGSQEIEPPDGWPYHRVLQFLADNPQAENLLLSQTFVSQFGAFYAGKGKDVTQSALHTAFAEAVAAGLNEFTGLLLEHMEPIKPQLAEVLNAVQKFRDTDYIDLFDFVHLCENNLDLPWGSTATNLKQAVRQAVVASVRHGQSVANAHGIAIYMPLRPPGRDVMDIYEKLDIHRCYGNWLELIHTYHRVKPLKR